MIFKVSALTEEGTFIQEFDLPVPGFMTVTDQLGCLLDSPRYLRWQADHRIDAALHMEIEFANMTIKVTRKDEE